jgi:hypothetical protein
MNATSPHFEATIQNFLGDDCLKVEAGIRTSRRPKFMPPDSRFEHGALHPLRVTSYSHGTSCYFTTFHVVSRHYSLKLPPPFRRSFVASTGNFAAAWYPVAMILGVIG